MSVLVTEEPFDPLEAVLTHQRNLSESFGGTAIFIGTMRDFGDAGEVRSMVLEHYPAMTGQHLQRISDEARERWEIIDTLIVHRVGRLEPSDPIVVVAAWAAHRAEAFAACRYLIEELKSRAPFWKKETLSEGERWVEHNTPG